MISVFRSEKWVRFYYCAELSTKYINTIVGPDFIVTYCCRLFVRIKEGEMSFLGQFIRDCLVSRILKMLGWVVYLTGYSLA